MLERLGIGGVLATLSHKHGWSDATVLATKVNKDEGTMTEETIRRSDTQKRGRCKEKQNSSYNEAVK